MLESIEDILSQGKYNYIKSTMNKKAVPTVKLLIKDGKKLEENGDPKIRLVIPAKNFTAGFPRVGQRGIKQIMQKKTWTLIYAGFLKTELENIGIRLDETTQILFDARELDPSIKCNVIRKAIHYFLTDAPENDKAMVNKCLEMVKFGMANTLVTFQGEY